MSEADRRKWDSKYRASEGLARKPSAFIDSIAHLLPKQGAALDVAGGAGRHAIWLAKRGLRATLVDISAEALVQAGREAAAAGLELTTIAADLDTDALPTGPWDVIVSVDFLWPPVFRVAHTLLAPGGLLVYEQPTRKNLERHSSPSERFLLVDGALPVLVGSLEILQYTEGWIDDRHVARLLARRKT